MSQSEPETYRGSAWRARFIRAPKLALEVAQMDAFAAVDEVASVVLGAKTGADNYFFVEKVGRDGDRLKIEGMEHWTGALPRKDLRAAVQSPKDLDVATPRGKRRLARIQLRTWSSFYFAPRPGYTDKAVRDYVHYGEAQRIPERTLVADNAVGERWYIQRDRLHVSADWMLPYNSGYDYGATWSEGALIGGRLVGVTPRQGIDTTLLGAALNSSATIATRLLVGVATGNEGAFDVGPPAVRLMRIPDPRRLDTPAVRQSFEAILEEGCLPPGPNRRGEVDEQRLRLDRAVFEALGLAPGASASLCDRLYASYSRWRTSVEDVESRMQDNRRALARRGGSRRENPVARATRTVTAEMQPLPPLFADLMPSPAVEVLDARLADTPSDQDALVPDTSVNVGGLPVDLGSEERVDFVRALRQLGARGPIPVPRSSVVCAAAGKAAAVALARVRQEAAARAVPYVGVELADDVAQAVVRNWAAAAVSDLQTRFNNPADVVAVPGADPSLFEPEGLVPPIDHRKG
jgi:hypothetical protein